MFANLPMIAFFPPFLPGCVFAFCGFGGGVRPTYNNMAAGAIYGGDAAVTVPLQPYLLAVWLWVKVVGRTWCIA